MAEIEFTLKDKERKIVEAAFKARAIVYNMDGLNNICKYGLLKWAHSVLQEAAHTAKELVDDT